MSNPYVTADNVPKGFIDYVRANYSGIVEFSDPAWHAKRLWAAAMIHGRAPAQEQAKPSDCLHDGTVRQGAIWTACQQCGKRWADDELAAHPPASPSEPERSGESGGDMITLPIALVASACYVIRKNGEHESLLAKLRAYTTGEFSRPAASSSAAPSDEVAVALRKAFMTLESNGQNAGGRNLVLKFNQREDSYVVHDFLLKLSALAAPAPTVESVGAAVPDEQTGWYAAAQWLRNHYQGYANIADTCAAMEFAAPNAAPITMARELPDTFRFVSKKDGTELWLQFDGGSVCLNNIANDRGPIIRRNFCAAIKRLLTGAAKEAM